MGFFPVEYNNFICNFLERKEGRMGEKREK